MYIHTCDGRNFHIRAYFHPDASTKQILRHFIYRYRDLATCCGWESLMKSVTLGNVTMSHRTREPAECLASLSHSTMIGLPRAQH
ncbi:hypothetical protein EVAR_69371_1 [Eumeta japonica]|uniref:Uncharacterized protein n=1 Tax=Eumeta variegata TaxID=151549 RepID=A0A4C1ZXY3_EUMVA|nr:hypothetical protein EVAR_69371_1 [Eumeta japonica]